MPLDFTSELRTVRTPLGDVTTFDRDSAGRPSSVTLPWGAQKSYAYADNDPNPETVTLPQGTTLNFQYDAAKRETQRTSSLGESRSFTYGKQDRIQTMTDATGTTTYEYDAAGRFAGIVYPHGGSVRYVRDALGRTVEQSVRTSASASPLVTAYAYDAVGNLARVTDPQGGETTFVYDAENRLTSRTLPNNVVTTYTYDERDRPLSVVHRNAANLVLASRTYVRAPGGEPTRITKEDGSYVEIGYDAALRITSERYYTSGGELEDELLYTYDADGNRATKTVNGVVSTYHYASGARLTGITTAGVTESRTTDDGGRETALALMSHQLELTYDSDDHVTRVVDGATTTDFAFDAAGRRVGVTASGESKRFLQAPNGGDGYESPQAVTDASGALIASYVIAGETPIAKSTASGTQYYLTDAMGSVIATAGDTGVLGATLDYDAFGNERTSGALASDTYGDFRLHGMWKDPSGLYYVRARVYNVETGTFASRDPAEGDLSRAETFAPYQFAAGNPFRWRDPSGRNIVAISVGIAITGILGGITYGAMSSAWRNGGRHATSTEQTFLNKYFSPRMSGSLKIRDGGHWTQPGRAFAPAEDVIYLPDAYFQGRTQAGEVNLADARVAAILAHEVLHNWQRKNGHLVSAPGLAIGAVNSVVGDLVYDPYDYPLTKDAEETLHTFLNGNIEQQGQIFQDYVYADLTRGDTSKYLGVATFVRALSFY